MEITIAAIAAIATSLFALAIEAQADAQRKTAAACRLMFTGAAILCFVSIYLSANQPSANAHLVRSWYIGTSAAMTGLAMICCPRLISRFSGAAWSIVTFVCLLIALTDHIVAGAITLPSALSSTGTMTTRVPGRYYIIWLVFVAALLVIQCVSLSKRAFFGTNKRDQNAALWLLLCLVLVHMFTVFLIVEMLSEKPRFNSVTILPASILTFCLGVYYTETHHELIPLNFRAFLRDGKKLDTLLHILQNSSLSASQKLKKIKQAGFVSSDSGALLRIDSQHAICIDLRSLCWSKSLTTKAGQIKKACPGAVCIEL